MEGLGEVLPLKNISIRLGRELKYTMKQRRRKK
jgi:hypothetical protein